MKLVAKILTVLGVVAATAGSTACVSFILDEPKMPKSLIK